MNSFISKGMGQLVGHINSQTLSVPNTTEGRAILKDWFLDYGIEIYLNQKCEDGYGAGGDRYGAGFGAGAASASGYGDGFGDGSGGGDGAGFGQGYGNGWGSGFSISSHRQAESGSGDGFGYRQIIGTGVVNPRGIANANKLAHYF